MDYAHQALMDRVYRNMKYVYDATRPFFLAGRRHLRQRIAATCAQAIWEVGCGTGRNLVLLGKIMPDAHFTGLDISREMCAYARAKIEDHALSDRVQIIEAELEDHRATQQTQSAEAPAPRWPDVIVFSYSLSMIPNWQDNLIHALSVLSDKGGCIVIADFGPCQSWPDIARRRLYKNLSYFHVFPRSGLVPHLEALGLSADVRAFFGGYAHFIEIAVPPGFTPTATEYPNSSGAS